MRFSAFLHPVNGPKTLQPNVNQLTDGEPPSFSSSLPKGISETDPLEEVLQSSKLGCKTF